MWSDNETSTDFLNFRTVADTAAEMIYRAGGKPLSMGISGGWGVGKSSMVKLIRESLAERFGEKFVFVEYNAWLYQGYDDAKAALLDGHVFSADVCHRPQIQIIQHWRNRQPFLFKITTPFGLKAGNLIAPHCGFGLS